MTDRRNSFALSLLGGRYRLGDLVGRGGMADVYAAVDERTGARVAVKVFRDPLVPGAEAEVRNGDVSALEGLRHPGLVELLDVGEEQGRPFCVMTLVDGPTLAERLVQGPLTQEAVARIGSDLAAALAYVHDRGVVHRDVKPANVLLGGDGRARLADFGIARLVDATRVTRSGFTIGTAGYLAPEQVNGDRITPAADLYALGLVLLECLSGRREYDGPVIEAALARLHRRPQVPDHLPSGWRAFLQALTADDPQHRPSAAVAASAAGVLADQPRAPAESLRLDRLVREPGPRVVVPNEPLAPSAPAAGPGDGPGHEAATQVGQRAPSPPAPSPPAPSPPAPSPPAPSATAPARSRRTVVLATSACALVLAASAAFLLTRGPDAGPASSAAGGTAPASSGPASPEPAVPGASSSAPAVPPQQALAELTSEVQAAVEAAPPGGAGFAPDLLERLVDLAALEGPPQANTAIALADDVGQAVDAGRYDAALGERARTVLDRVAAPEDLVALVRLARYDVEALGTDGAALERRLTALDHQTATEDVPATARQLLQSLEQGQASGRVGPAFGRAAAPVLEPLARTESLDALRQAVDRLGTDPQSSGEVGGEVLERMEQLLDENVYNRTLGARALLRDVHDAADRGDLSASFRDEAVQVLVPLAQRGPSPPR